MLGKKPVLFGSISNPPADINEAEYTGLYATTKDCNNVKHFIQNVPLKP
jgi:hypothetical protein